MEKADLSHYYDVSGQFLSLIDISTYRYSLECGHAQGLQCIDKFYTDIVRALTESAKRVVPSHQHNFYKFWWNEELSLLKQNSIDSYKLWTSGGKPRSGFLFDNMSKNKRVYKIAIKNNEMSNRDIFSNALNEALLDKDTDNFWKSWRSKFGKDKVNSLVIDGECSANIIAQNFAGIFKDISVPNSSEKHNALKTNFFTQFKDYSSDVRSDFMCYSLLIDTCIKKLKLGKAALCCDRSIIRLFILSYFYATPVFRILLLRQYLTLERILFTLLV